jgi:hypothetical protein
MVEPIDVWSEKLVDELVVGGKQVALGD